MKLVVEADDFSNGFFITDLPNNYYIVMNNIQEHISDGTDSVSIDRILIEIRRKDSDDVVTVYSCPSIIGFGNKMMYINTDDNSLLGQKLTIDNLERCWIEIYV